MDGNSTWIIGQCVIYINFCLLLIYPPSSPAVVQHRCDSLLPNSCEKRLTHPTARHRFVHHAGQEFPRLDREQSILATPPDMDHWIFRLCSSLCFGMPELHYSRFNKIYVDHEVDVRDFRSFISNCMDDWKSSLSWVSFLSASKLFNSDF